MSEKITTKPILILPRGQMSDAAINMLRANGLCVVTAKDPSLIRFVETPNLDYTRQEQAAIALVRKLLAEQKQLIFKNEIDNFLAHELINGSPLKPVSPPAKP